MEEPTSQDELGASFRQARKEFWFMIGTWVVFAAWTTGFNWLFASGRDGESVHIVFGIPSWVVFGVVVPWILALSLTIWFAMRFMKDTDLGEEAGTGEAE